MHPLKEKADALRERLKKKREDSPKRKMVKPFPPRYDALFFESMAAVDAAESGGLVQQVVRDIAAMIEEEERSGAEEEAFDSEHEDE